MSSAAPTCGNDHTVKLPTLIGPTSGGVKSWMRTDGRVRDCARVRPCTSAAARPPPTPSETAGTRRRRAHGRYGRAAPRPTNAPSRSRTASAAIARVAHFNSGSSVGNGTPIYCWSVETSATSPTIPPRATWRCSVSSGYCGADIAEAPQRNHQRRRGQSGGEQIDDARLNRRRGVRSGHCLSPVDGTPGTTCPFTFAAACQSVIVTVAVLRLHNHPSAHLEMQRAAEVRAVEPIDARLAGVEGEGLRVARRQRDIEVVVGQRKAVDHVADRLDVGDLQRDPIAFLHFECVRACRRCGSASCRRSPRADRCGRSSPAPPAPHRRPGV